jgi:hypothetical protein
LTLTAPSARASGGRSHATAAASTTTLERAPDHFASAHESRALIRREECAELFLLVFHQLVPTLLNVQHLFERPREIRAARRVPAAQEIAH